MERENTLGKPQTTPYNQKKKVAFALSKRTWTLVPLKLIASIDERPSTLVIILRERNGDVILWDFLAYHL
jgi:hypothetical protein